MTENRFERAYQEYKREREQISTRVSSRFDCLRSEPLRPPQIRQSAGRFECLADDYYPRQVAPVQDTIVYLPKPEPTKPVQNQPTYLPKPEAPKPIQSQPVYLPRPEPQTKVETTPAVKVEPWRRGQAKKPTEPVNDINYHFPALGCTRGELPRAEIKLPESKEMIVKPIVVPNNKKVLTMMSFKDGKVVSKEVYEDGTELPDDNLPVIIKKPKYTSWASVLKKDEEEVVYYDVEPQK